MFSNKLKKNILWQTEVLCHIIFLIRGEECSRNQLCQKGIFVHFCTFGLYQMIYKGSNKLPASCFPCIASGYAFYTLTNHLPAFLKISFRQRMCFKVEL